MNITREDLINAFALWTIEFNEHGDDTKTIVGTREHEEESADYMIELLKKVQK